MFDSAIVFTYTRAFPGREEKALEVFTESLTFFAAASHDGTCGEPLSIMATDGQGYMIVPGEYDALAKLIRTEDFRELFTKAVFAVSDVGYELAAYGQGVQDLMARWTRVGKELAIL